MSTIQEYRQIVRNQDRFEGALRKRGDIQRDIAYFEANIGKVGTTEALMKDDKLYRFVMEAFDLGSQTFARGLIRKVLNEGVADPKSTANRMTDPKFKEMATILGFKENGGASLKEPKIVKAIVDRFVDVKMEVAADETNPAVRLALYFQRRAPGLSNWFQVLGDAPLQKVVFTALDIPDAAALQDVDRLAEKLSAKFDIKDFKDPAKLQKLLDRFAAMYDLRNDSSATSATMPSIGPISRGGRASIISIDPSITMSLMSFPRF
ncbi:DUF1217 domain-containing protein [Azospirillum doebereinerae]|uniref:DUF1217 domain-containing protein n=1 Tax=Azospirillum doebereinerae TaxID=92933 RepID=A0A3S0VFT9_9PROT|nr:DUF1217 domain-containing protein [Azospirillum doebereinerae]MCG5243497.1 DUF1217 domain-containing protein [Azospirillum doebereinerae]RUQ66607.1 DUF1217 domain-containing protein [Azospirillum doebereinerae]